MNENGNLGRKLILWQTEFSRSAYTDQFGASHEGYKVLGEFAIEIVETRKVKNCWADGFSEGWRAVTPDGIEFTCNWEVFPDDSITPTFYWQRPDQSYMFVFDHVDAEQAVNSWLIFATPEGNKAIPTGFKKCNEHNIWYDKSCWKCDYFEMKKRKNAQT